MPPPGQPRWGARFRPSSGFKADCANRGKKNPRDYVGGISQLPGGLRVQLGVASFFRKRWAGPRWPGWLGVEATYQSFRRPETAGRRFRYGCPKVWPHPSR